jgi:Tfp pilus assembly protein PilN
MKRILGIHFTLEHCRIVQLSSTRASVVQVEKTACLSLNEYPWLGDEQTGEMGLALETLMDQAGFDPKALCATNVPSQQVYHTMLETDLAHVDDVRRMLLFELEDDVPVEFDNLAADLMAHFPVGDSYRSFIAATRQSHVQTVKGVLTAAGVTCSSLSTDISALSELSRFIPDLPADLPCVIIGIHHNRCTICVKEGGHLLGGRSLLLDKNPLDWARTLGRELDIMTRVMPQWTGHRQAMPMALLGSESVCAALKQNLEQQTGQTVVIPDLGESIPVLPGCQLDSDYTMALGLALSYVGQKDPRPNFIASQLNETRRTREIRRSGVLCGTLAALLLLLLCVRSVYQIKELDYRHRELKQEIRDLFSENVPEIKKIVRPLPQMTEQLDRLRKTYQDLAQIVRQRALPMDVLRTVSDKVQTDHDVILSYMALDHESVKVAGSGTSFESVEALAAELRQAPGFTTVKLEDVGVSKVDNRIQFRLYITRIL